jgi:hypothetical protein
VKQVGTGIAMGMTRMRKLYDIAGKWMLIYGVNRLDQTTRE